jgi:hypothetical protein
MTKPIYQEVIENGVVTTIKRTDTDGVISWIPTDPANSDYQAYLNKDNPVEHFTPMVTDADKS